MEGTLLIVEPTYFTFEGSEGSEGSDGSKTTTAPVTPAAAGAGAAAGEGEGDETITYLQRHRVSSLIASLIDPTQLSTIEMKSNDGRHMKVDVEESQMEDLISMTHLTSTLSTIIEEFQKVYTKVSASCIKSKVREIALREKLMVSMASVGGSTTMC